MTAIPESADQGGANRRAPGLQRRTLVLAALVASGILFAATTQTWVLAEGLGDTAPVAQVEIPGTEISDLVTAMALVGLAAAVAVSIARRVLRYAVGAVLVGAGLLALVQVVGVIADPAGASMVALGETTGTTEPAESYGVGVAAYAAAAGAGLMLISGAALLMVAHRWQDAKASKKYSRTGAVDGASADEPDEFDLWDGLSQGDDPTEGRD
ncbi:Trp biosynthesis-associated membrane protein [Nesterenkonia sp. NBAIMH1]|uniref:Trp biosynthesis-associated membrane protein n=1 Tax=Nesterenkonia sp. NBAIMH1 TaxID=2600320 RepID=UPI0011B3EAA4|nr:Trp biosynthesis-associated membrane protein [Nesterenkonia sp. NBAIMH1]